MFKKPRKTGEASFLARHRNKITGTMGVLGTLTALGAFGYALISGGEAASTATELNTQRAYAAADAEDKLLAQSGMTEELDLNIRGKRTTPVPELEKRLTDHKDSALNGGAASLAGVILAGGGIIGLKREEPEWIKEDLQYHHDAIIAEPTTVELTAENRVRTTTVYIGRAAVVDYRNTRPSPVMQWLNAA